MSSQVFRYESFTIDAEHGRLTCTYTLDGREFTERVTLPPGPAWSTPAARAAARLVFLLAGVSYYKTAAPPVIDLGSTPLTPRERDFLRDFYVNGLAEFAYRNGLDLTNLQISAPQPSGQTSASPQISAPQPPPQASGARGSLGSGAPGASAAPLSPQASGARGCLGSGAPGASAAPLSPQASGSREPLESRVPEASRPRPNPEKSDIVFAVDSGSAVIPGDYGAQKSPRSPKSPRNLRDPDPSNAPNPEMSEPRGAPTGAVGPYLAEVRGPAEEKAPVSGSFSSTRPFSSTAMSPTPHANTEMSDMDEAGVTEMSDMRRGGGAPGGARVSDMRRGAGGTGGGGERTWGRALVPFGGGIDSIVTVEQVRARADVKLFVVSRPGDTYDAIEQPAAVANLPITRAEREIDPQLLRSAEYGFLNGHVPVTGIISAIAVLAAVLEDRDAVVMSNEWSASIPTLEFNGTKVNHQYSKSEEFERAFRGVLAQATEPMPDYFSWLRDRTELWVGREFANLEKYHSTFRSCNKAFYSDKNRRLDHWCGQCDKCCFIDLILAPFLSAQALGRIFAVTGEPLRQPGLTTKFRALLGAGAKPFECVGEVTECRAAALFAAERADRADDTLLQQLAADVKTWPDAPTAAEAERMLRPVGPSFVPDRYR